MRVLVAGLVLIGCSSSNTTNNNPRAVLQVAFGSQAPITLDVDVASNFTSTRLMLQSSHSGITVFVSLPLPLQQDQLPISIDSTAATLWAKQNSTGPLIATTGTVVLNKHVDFVDFTLVEASKPEDPTGASLLVTGAITGVSHPP